MTETDSTLLGVSLALLLLAGLGTACERPQNGSGGTSAESNPAREKPGSDSDGKTSGAQKQGSANCAAPKVEGVGARAVAPDHTFDKPLYLTQPPGASETLYVVEQPGRILKVRDGEVVDEPFLDIRERVGRSHNERGLLGLAFHPDYPENGRFFIYYTPADAHKNVVAEYRHTGDGAEGDVEEYRRLVEVKDPEGNHNGGMVTFGPDGHLYAALGDGGGAGDQHGDIGNGQNKNTLLGSILRLDVDAPDRDFAPEDNPFAGDTEGADQIWAWGLRNAWRFSFDSETGDLYMGDVGQNKIEEIDVQPADSDGGENYGWRAYEGDEVYDESLAKKVDDAVDPILAFEQRLDEAPVRNACSVTGGYVYRGEALGTLEGAYLYGDYCSDDIAALRYCDGEVAGPRRIPGLTGLGDGLASFGTDNAGELYLLYRDSGDVKKLVPD